MMTVLIRKTLRDHRRLVLWWGVGLLAMGGVELWAYTFMAKAGPGAQDFVNSFPESMRAMFRMQDYFSGPGFLGTELFSFMVQLVFIAVGATMAAAATAGEEERRTADLLLTLPVARRRVLLAKLGTIALVQAAIAVVFIAFLWLTMPLADMVVALPNVAAATLQCALLGMLCAGVAALIGAWKGHRGLALGVAMSVAIVSFIVYSLAPMVSALDTVVQVVPWQWAMGNGPLKHGVSVADVAMLAATTLVLVAGSVACFERRDIAS